MIFFNKAYSFDDVLLVPKFFTNQSRSEVDISTKLFDLEFKIPIIAANMPSVCEHEMAATIGSLGGLGIIHRMQSIQNQAEQVEWVKKTMSAGYVGAAIGIGNDWKARASDLVQAGVDVLCIDVAHGAQTRVEEVIKEFFEQSFRNIPLIVGNYATPRNLPNYKVCYKVGVGGGSMCTTRIKTGCGVPTFHSLLMFNTRSHFNERSNQFVFREHDSFIADGGIKNSGDIVKSLAAGASFVMLGSLLAGTDEAPGEVIKGTDGNKYKIYRGAASYGAKREFYSKAEYVEGEETLVPYKGSAVKVVNKLVEGIKSGFSYCGVDRLKSLQDQAEFIEISQAGYNESRPHGLL